MSQKINIGVIDFQNQPNKVLGTDADGNPELKDAAGLGAGVSEEQMNTAIDAAIDALLAGAPGALNTLNELAAALGNDANFAATVTAALAGKANGAAVQVHTSGTTATVANATGPILYLVNPASLLATLSIPFPTTPYDGQPFEVVFGGAIAAGSPVVTAVSFTPTPMQATTPSEVLSGETIAYRYRSATSKWYRAY